MIEYLIKSMICLALIYTFYYLILEKQRMHHFKRFYLLGSIPLSLIIPVVPIYSDHLATMQPIGISPQVDQALMVQILIVLIYFIGAIFLLTRLVINITSLVKTANGNVKVIQNGATVVLLRANILPHTFINWIFVNQEDYQNNKINDELLTHELTHVEQKHSWDVIMIEVVRALLWFNPVLIYLNRSIRLNHEFLADENVVAKHKNIPAYQQLLLNLTQGNTKISLSSTINFSLIKLRYKMMTKASSWSSKILKVTSVLPLILLSVLLFGNSKPIEEHGISSESKLERFHKDKSSSIESKEHAAKESQEISREHR